MEEREPRYRSVQGGAPTPSAETEAAWAVTLHVVACPIGADGFPINLLTREEERAFASRVRELRGELERLEALAGADDPLPDGVIDLRRYAREKARRQSDSGIGAADSRVHDEDEPDWLARTRAAAINELDAVEGHFIRHNVRLVFHAVRRVARAEERKDLLLHGLEALFVALMRFDPSREWKFSTFATPVIHGAISAGWWARASGPSVPRRQRKLLRLVRDTREAFHRDHGRHPTSAEVAQMLGFDDPAKVDRLLAIGLVMSMASLDRRLVDSDEELGDRIADPNAGAPVPFDHDTKERTVVAARLRRVLTPRERMIVRRRFGFGCEAETLESIGKSMGISRERVRQIEAVALRKLAEDASMQSLSARYGGGKVFRTKRAA